LNQNSPKDLIQPPEVTAISDKLRPKDDRMTRLAFLLLTAAALLGADNPWTKVQELKSGSELRIYKKGSMQPVIATFDEANEERVIIVVKNVQTAVPKEDIERIDARPAAQKTRKINSESTAKTTNPDYTDTGSHSVPVPGTSYSSSVGMSGSPRPDFETIYRRPMAGPKK
jgi:hypothetical protein